MHRRSVANAEDHEHRRLDLTIHRQPKPADALRPVGELLDEMSARFARHLVLPDGADDALALWVAHTWVFDRFPISPYLHVMTATKGCGKTTTFELLTAFSRKSFNATSATEASVFRLIDKHGPTLLLDEGDTYLIGKDGLTGVLNGGHKKSSARVMRCTSDTFDVQFLKTWGPKAFASIGRLNNPALEERCVRILLKRKTKQQVVEEIDPEALLTMSAPIRSGAVAVGSGPSEPAVIEAGYAGLIDEPHQGQLAAAVLDR